MRTTVPRDDLLLDLAVTRFVAWEGRLIDERRWGEWLELFTPDATFWMPGRERDGRTVAIAEEGINLMYLKGRSALENRVQRIQDGDSVANTPLPRTCHLIGSVLAERVDEVHVRATSSWTVTASNPMRGLQQRTGHYEHLLRREGEGFRITQKKVLMIDEVFDGFIDVYLV
jgi:3-phenylpropionate/cinnamic acid dioxygenase small subunit